MSGNSVSYSLDYGKTWTTLASNTDSPTVNAGEKIMFKATVHSYDGTFSSTGAFKAYGNVMSLIDGDNFVGQESLGGIIGVFYSLFSGCTGITDAGNLVLPATAMTDECYECMFAGCTSLTKAPSILPATTLANLCYCDMFSDCTSLANAPELPATTMKAECYEGMFSGCTSLTKAPELPATKLEVSCYRDMFRGCTSLTKTPELPAITTAEYCYSRMFRGCTSLTKAPELPATTLANCCYESMFEGCTSLVSAPELPAATLVSYCYDSMFYGCTSLNYIKAMFTTTPSDAYTPNWVYGVSTAGTFVKSSVATWNVTGVNGVPTGWDVETEDTSKIVLFIDDFRNEVDRTYNDLQFWAEECGYDTVQEYVDAMDEDPENFGMDMYVLLSYGFEWHGSKYYIWGHVPTAHNSDIDIVYMLTETANYGELYKKSLAYNIFNTQIPYVIRLGHDFKDYETPYKLLVTVKHMDQNGNVY